MPPDSKVLARNVLRHIREPDVLRSNPLTQRFFRAGLNAESSLVTIRAIIMAALPPHSRARQIVEQCDFNGRPHKTVRREMVLSERQFYRERSRAFDVVGRALERDPARVTSADADLVMRIESLYDLAAFGHTGAVRRIVAQTLATGVPDSIAARLLALNAAACSYDGDTNEAAESLHAAETRAVSAIDRSDIVAAYAVRPCVEGALGESVAKAREAADLSRTDTVLSDPSGLRAHIRQTILLANLHDENDDAATSLRLLEYSQGLVMSRAPDDAALTALIKAEIGWVALCLIGEVPRAVAELNDAQTLASRARYTALQALVEVGLACAKVVAAPAEAAAHARISVEMSIAALSGEYLARVLLTCARILTLCGDAPGALGLITLARPHFVPGSYVEAASLFRRADALSVVGQHKQAALLAEQACSRLSAVNTTSQYLGSAHLSAAVANAALGHREDAMEHVEVALPLLERAGFLFETKRANQIAARISGNNRYVQRTEEIRRFLSAS